MSIRYEFFSQNNPKKPIFHIVNWIQLESGPSATKIMSTTHQGYWGDLGPRNSGRRMNRWEPGVKGLEPGRGSREQELKPKARRARGVDLTYTASPLISNFYMLAFRDDWESWILRESFADRC
jgi:hypothetical protein